MYYSYYLRAIYHFLSCLSRLQTARCCLCTDSNPLHFYKKTFQGNRNSYQHTTDFIEAVENVLGMVLWNFFLSSFKFTPLPKSNSASASKPLHEHSRKTVLYNRVSPGDSLLRFFLTFICL